MSSSVGSLLLIAAYRWLLMVVNNARNKTHKHNSIKNPKTHKYQMQYRHCGLLPLHSAVAACPQSQRSLGCLFLRLRLNLTHSRYSHVWRQSPSPSAAHHRPDLVVLNRKEEEDDDEERTHERRVGFPKQDIHKTLISSFVRVEFISVFLLQFIGALFLSFAKKKCLTERVNFLFGCGFGD